MNIEREIKDLQENSRARDLDYERELENSENIGRDEYDERIEARQYKPLFVIKVCEECHGRGCAECMGWGEIECYVGDQDIIKGETI